MTKQKRKSKRAIKRAANKQERRGGKPSNTPARRHVRFTGPELTSLQGYFAHAMYTK